MIKGARVILRPVRQSDWALFEQWRKDREALWGSYQRFQCEGCLRRASFRDGLWRDMLIYGLLRSDWKG